MYRVYLYKTALFAAGAALLALGIVILSQREVLLGPLAYFSGAVLIIHGGMDLVTFFTRGGKIGEKRRKARLITAVWNIISGIVIPAFPELSFSFCRDHARRLSAVQRGIEAR